MSSFLWRGAVDLDSRYSFTAQFIRAGAFFSVRASDLEVNAGASCDDHVLMQHRAYVVSAVFQSVAALEADCFEVVEHGPGHHLGSNLNDLVARDFLRPLAGLIDKCQVLVRYEKILHLLNKEPILRGENPWRETDLLVKLRNELVHYKSRLTKDLEQKNLYESLRNLKHRQPPWILKADTFFPARCLNAECAQWAVEASANFLNTFYDRIELRSPIAPFMSEINKSDS